MKNEYATQEIIQRTTARSVKKNPQTNKTQMSKIAHPVLGLETLQNA